MNGIVISRSKMVIHKLEAEADGLLDLRLVKIFYGIAYAQEYVSKRDIDLVFIDLEIAKANQKEIYGMYRAKSSDLKFVIIMSDEACPLDIIHMHPIAFLAYDFSKEDLYYAVKIATLLSAYNKRKRIFVRTFGYFDIFVDEKAVMFKSAKAKELLAFLIDRRGGAVTTGQIISVLWEDRPNDEASQNLCSKLVKTLQKELKEAGIEEMLVIARGSRCVNTEVFQCDLYDLLDGSRKARQQYAGEYMQDYSWAEYRVAILDHFLH